MSIIGKGNLIGKIETEGELKGHISITPVPPNLQDKSVEITENTTQTITADEGYNGLGEVEIITNVTPTLQNKTVNPSTSEQVIEADSNYDGLGRVSISPVDNTIDSNIQANNIKAGIGILGVIGTYDQSIEFGQYLDSINGEEI